MTQSTPLLAVRQAEWWLIAGFGFVLAAVALLFSISFG